MLVASLVLGYFLTERVPDLIREAGYARRGQESPAGQARRQKLVDAGIDPAAGGAFGQFAGNLWRDTWLDLDERRHARRLKRPPFDPDAASRWDRWRDRLDRAVHEGTRRWRDPATDDAVEAEWWDTEPQPAPTPEPPPATPDQAGSDPDPAPGGEPSPSGEPQPASPPGPPPWAARERLDPEDAHRWAWDHEPFTHPTQPPTQPEPEGPLKGDLNRTAPEPQHQPAALEGAPTMTAVVPAGRAVTGVVSGAAEARAIQRALETANAAYTAELARIRHRIASLGEQTLSAVQMSTRSRVVAWTVQAAESAAAAQAAARTCGAEVGPLMGQVAREFQRLNS